MPRRDHKKDIESQAERAQEHAEKQREDIKKGDMQSYQIHGKHATKAVKEAWKDKGWKDKK